MSRTLTSETPEHVGKTVTLAGWVQTVRSHGKIIFLDLRDRKGIVQAVVSPKHAEAYAAAKKVSAESVVELVGEVVKRPANMQNADLATGSVELVVQDMTVLATAATLPFGIDTDGYELSEEKRMQYRYVDLRRQRMQRNLRVRDKVVQFARDFLHQEDFIEVETPLLSKSTPEGARDFVVPSRLHPGNFYALPQSPQQYKQLLQVAGIERYFQIARCFRDEDPRGDRQPEHTQLDIEMSFVEREEVMALVETLLIALVKKLFPEKKIQKVPFPRIPYEKAMKQYGTDRPDLRKNTKDKNVLAFCWVIDFPFFEKTDEGMWTFTHNPFSAAKPEHRDDLLQKKNIAKIITSQYDCVLNGWEIGGGSIRNHQPEALEAVFEIIGYKKADIQKNFGHMMAAFRYGAPPHGGIAPGIDRIVALLLNEPNIREVITFPKTGDGRDLMMGAPSEASKEQLDELHLSIKKPTKKRSQKK